MPFQPHRIIEAASLFVLTAAKSRYIKSYRRHRPGYRYRTTSQRSMGKELKMVADY